jgi:hypothetical protein
MSRQSLAVFALALSSGCMKAPPPPQPTQLHVARPPAEVVRTATRELTQAGFQIDSSDANTGTVVAHRTRTPQEHGGDVTCKYQQGSLFATRAQSTLATAVTARPGASGGSDVGVTSIVHMDFSNMPGQFRAKPNDTDCVSSGVIEKRLVAALQ